MRVTTKLTLDMETGRVLEHEFYEYTGPVALCKNKESKRFAAQQRKFALNLQKAFEQRFREQTDLLNLVREAIQPMLVSPTGFAPEEEAALRTSATEQIASQFAGAQRALQERQFSAGTRLIPSGAALSQQADLLTAQAIAEAEAQRNISIQNALLRRQNQFTAANILGGLASTASPAPIGSLAVGQGQVAFQQTRETERSVLARILGGIAGGIGGAFFPAVGNVLAGTIFGTGSSTTSTATKP